MFPEVEAGGKHLVNLELHCYAAVKPACLHQGLKLRGSYSELGSYAPPKTTGTSRAAIQDPMQGT